MVKFRFVFFLQEESLTVGSRFSKEFRISVKGIPRDGVAISTELHISARGFPKGWGSVVPRILLFLQEESLRMG